jgi:hypothetical protein
MLGIEFDRHGLSKWCYGGTPPAQPRSALLTAVSVMQLAYHAKDMYDRLICATSELQP